MSQRLYTIWFEGKVQVGIEANTAKQKLQALFKADDEKIARVFSGKRVALKKDIPASNIERYVKAFRATGIEFIVEPPLPSEQGQAQEPMLTLEPLVSETAEANHGGDESTNPYANPTEHTAVETMVFCRTCGKKIRQSAALCPECGAKQVLGKPKEKAVAVILGVLLGWAGAHRLYLGQWWGLFYLFFGIFSWAIAIIESIVFLFSSNETWNRKYGNVVASSNAALIVVAAFVFVAVMGILAAVAIPAYQDYTHRAKVASAVSEATPYVDQVSEFIVRVNFVPNSNLDAGLSEDIMGEHFKSLRIEENGVIVVTLKDKSGGGIDNETMTWTPSYKNGAVTWDCSGGTLTSRIRPARCQAGQYSSEQSKGDTRWQVASSQTFKMRIPNAWQEMEELSDVAEFEFGNGILEQYVVVITDNKVDFAPSAGINDFKDLALQGYAELDDEKITFSHQDNINGVRTLVYEITARVDNINVTYLLGVMEGEYSFYQVLFWTLPSRWERNSRIFIESLKSFQECPNGCS